MEHTIPEPTPVSAIQTSDGELFHPHKMEEAINHERHVQAGIVLQELIAGGLIDNNMLFEDFSVPAYSEFGGITVTGSHALDRLLENVIIAHGEYLQQKQLNDECAELGLEPPDEYAVSDLIAQRPLPKKDGE